MNKEEQECKAVEDATSHARLNAALYKVPARWKTYCRMVEDYLLYFVDSEKQHCLYDEPLLPSNHASTKGGISFLPPWPQLVGEIVLGLSLGCFLIYLDILLNQGN